jgi:aminopeptidase YwaD
MAKRSLFLPLLLLSSLLQAQKLKKTDKMLTEALQAHILYLADDRLGGRRTGTEGEKEAAAYISKAFSEIGLLPRGSNGFYQPFPVQEGKEATGSYLSINGQALELGTAFFPMAWSAPASLEANPSPALQEHGMPWFMDLSPLLEAAASNPHYDLEAALRRRAQEVKEKGASALILYNSSKKADGLQFNSKDRAPLAPLPVVYLRREASLRYLSDPTATLDVKLNIAIREKERSGTNVVAYLDNGAAATVVIGAHYDHLGHGEDANSRETSGNPVHNGADDNASGTAALIEIARLVKLARPKNHNYLFIAFSGEELGLYGSRYFTEHPTIDISTISYMVNMDMIGRLNDSTRTVTVGGYGTSPLWGQLYGQKGKKGLYQADLRFRFDSSGTGPSDHTSFYLRNIPVLFYFTGLHADYHKASDDADKINLPGQRELVKHIFSLLMATEVAAQKPVFTKTREAQTSTTARFTVSMGIMPDYTFSGSGVRVDGVSENRPAQKAGLRTGDVITALGERSITSMESYMQALSGFKKGDKAKVIYTRGSETLSTTVEF